MTINPVSTTQDSAAPVVYAREDTDLDLARKIYEIGRRAARKANDDMGYDRRWADLPETSRQGYKAIAAFMQNNKLSHD